jgi:hypothetical protein
MCYMKFLLPRFLDLSSLFFMSERPSIHHPLSFIRHMGSSYLVKCIQFHSIKSHRQIPAQNCRQSWNIWREKSISLPANPFVAVSWKGQQFAILLVGYRGSDSKDEERIGRFLLVRLRTHSYSVRSFLTFFSAFWGWTTDVHFVRHMSISQLLYVLTYEN